MRLDYFRFVMKRERAFWDITENVTLFSKPVELYNYKTDELKRYKKIDDVLDIEVEGKTIRQRIEELDDFPPIILNGGRGAGSGGNKEFSFGHAPHGDGSEDSKYGKPIPPAKLNTQIKTKTLEQGIKQFNKRHGLEDREYGAEMTSDGYVHNYITGAKTHVSMAFKGKLRRGEKSFFIHNHPSGGNFSDTDLINTAKASNSKGIVATGSKYHYKFTKGGHFKVNEFVRGVKTAKMKGKDYDDASDKWLRKNAKKYGYTYERIKV